MTQDLKVQVVKHYPVEDIKIDPALAVLPGLSKAAFEGMVGSVPEHGILHPLSVRRDGDAIILVDGWHRLHAAKRNNLKTVPCHEIKTDNPLATALAVAINRRNLTKTGVAYFVIHAYPELKERTGKHDSSTSFNKGRAGVGKTDTRADKGPTVQGMAEKYGIYRDCFYDVLAAIEACRPNSQDDELVRRLIIDEEVSATNLMKALQGWQASHPVGDVADIGKERVVLRAPANVIKGMKRSFTFIRNQSVKWNELNKATQTDLMDQFERTWVLLPPAMQAYALRKKETKDYAAAWENEKKLRKSVSDEEAVERLEADRN